MQVKKKKNSTEKVISLIYLELTKWTQLRAGKKSEDR